MIILTNSSNKSMETHAQVKTKDKQIEIKKIIILNIYFALGIVFLSGCVPTATMVQKEPTYQDVTYTMPKLQPAESSVQDQPKNNIRISCNALPFIAEHKFKQRYEQLNTLFVLNNQYPYEVTYIPYYEVNPINIRLKLKVYNQMNHILRLAGTVLSFQVAGKMVAVDKFGYEDFLSGIILPRQEMEFEITGPSIASLPDKCTIALLLYDIISDTDEAGNPAKKINFEWFYSFNKEIITKSEIVTTRKIKMTPEEAVSVGAPFAGK